MLTMGPWMLYAVGGVEGGFPGNMVPVKHVTQTFSSEAPNCN